MKEQGMRRFGVAWVLVVGLVLAGCGGGSGEPAAGGSEAAAELSSKSREEIVAAAEQESGELIVAGSYTDEQIEALAAAFNETYEWADAQFIDVGSDQAPTVLLELGSGTHRTDLIKIEEGTALPEYPPHMLEVDLPALIESGALENLQPQMVDPETGKLFAYATYLGVTSWNTDRVADAGIDMSQVETWEDILEACDSLEPGQVVMDVNAEMEAALAIAYDEEWITQFAADLEERCQPTFSRGGSGRIAGLAAGEYTINLVGNNHHALRVQAEGAPIELKFLTPITGKVSGLTGINATTERPHQALLMVDFLASAEAQQIMDELNPAGSFQSNDETIPQNEGLTNSEAVAGQETSIMDWEYFAQYPEWIEIMLSEWGYPTGEGE